MKELWNSFFKFIEINVDLFVGSVFGFAITAALYDPDLSRSFIGVFSVLFLTLALLLLVFVNMRKAKREQK